MSDKITSYLQLFGIPGECTDPRFPAYIPILSWSFADGNSATSSATRRSGGTGKVSMSEIFLNSALDMSSSKLQEYCACGRNIKSGKLVALIGDSVFFRATFEDLLVSEHQLNTGLTCSFTLTFHNMDTTYDPKAVNARMKQVGWTTTTSSAR